MSRRTQRAVASIGQAGRVHVCGHAAGGAHAQACLNAPWSLRRCWLQQPWAMASCAASHGARALPHRTPHGRPRLSAARRGSTAARRTLTRARPLVARATYLYRASAVRLACAGNQGAFRLRTGPRTPSACRRRTHLVGRRRGLRRAQQREQQLVGARVVAQRLLQDRGLLLRRGGRHAGPRPAERRPARRRSALGGRCPALQGDNAAGPGSGALAAPGVWIPQ